MPQSKPKKVVYLFGAGATHAELTNLEPTLIEEKLGLLIKNVSARVIEKARRKADYLKDVKMVSATKGFLNIELLVSLIESSKIENWEHKTRYLKGLVRSDIETILTKSRTRSFYLHKALLNFHQHRISKTREKLIGLISLNYDDVLDQAYKKYYGEPNYCFSLEQNAPLSEKLPLLKLHGSFNWSGKKIRGRTRTIEIIPLGASKNYLHAPYGFIWNRALEILIECDTLRVVGCSLSPNDAHLIDLLFKAHLEKGKSFDIEIISSESTGQAIRTNYGFFPKIKTLREIEQSLVPDPVPDNPFKTWMKYKAIRMLKRDAERTQYLNAVTA
jgi:hypothetical protein